MRTTLTIDDEVYREVRLCAARRGGSVSSVIEEAVRRYLLVEAQPEFHLLELPTMSSGGLQPGIDLDDMSSVYEVLDEGLSLDARR